MTLALRELQQAFARAVFEDDPALTPHLVDGAFGAERNLRVYRHNTGANLTDALAAVYPVVKRLVGDGFFDYAADRYWRAHPPAGGNIHDFGDSFPDFLSGFEPARSLVYLADVARLEWAWHRAFHAPDPAPFDRRQLADLDPADYGALRFRLHPSARLIKSSWPVLRIWEAHQQPGDPDPIDLDLGGEAADGASLHRGPRLDSRVESRAMQQGCCGYGFGPIAEAMLVIRRGLEVVVVRLSIGEHAFLASLARLEPLASACEAALSADPATDIPALLNRAVEEKFLVGITVPESNTHSGELP